MIHLPLQLLCHVIQQPINHKVCPSSVISETILMCYVRFFYNMTYSFVGLVPVDVVDIDEHYFGVNGISESILNQFLLKNWRQNMCHLCF